MSLVFDSPLWGLTSYRDLVGPRLWLGSYPSALSTEDLKRDSITHIISCMMSPKDFSDSFTQLKIDVEDSPNSNLMQYFDITYEFIESALKLETSGIFVHCMAGISRSSTIIAAYFMKKEKLSVEDALAKIREARPIIFPNLGFLQQLEMYQHDGYRIDPIGGQAYRRLLMQNMAIERKIKGYISRPVLSPDPLDAKAQDSLSMLSLNSTEKKETENKTNPLAKLHVSIPIMKSQPKLDEKGDRQHVKSFSSLRCKKCRKDLLTIDNVLFHVPGPGQKSFHPHKRDLVFSPSPIHNIQRVEAKTKLNTNAATDEYETTRDEAECSTIERKIEPMNNVSDNEEINILENKSIKVKTTNTSNEDSPDVIMKESQIRQSSHIDKKYESQHVTVTSMGITNAIPTHRECRSYFVEPMDWMNGMLYVNADTSNEQMYGPTDGKLSCPRCDSKLGNFNWAGLQCSCGAWITPAFSLHKSKVDEARC